MEARPSRRGASPARGLDLLDCDALEYSRERGAGVGLVAFPRDTDVVVAGIAVVAANEQSDNPLAGFENVPFVGGPDTACLTTPEGQPKMPLRHPRWPDTYESAEVD